MRLGVVVPSSNTVVEPTMSRLLGMRDDVSVHYARFPVHRLGLDDDAVRQFSTDRLVAAAELLSHAGVAAIAYCGVSGTWLGLDADRRFCAALSVPATTASLAVVEALKSAGVVRLGLVKAGSSAVTERVIATLRDEGLECAASVHLPAVANDDLAAVSGERLEEAIRSVATADVDAVCVLGTNLRAAPVVERLARSLEVQIIDSVVATAWKLCALAGLDSSTGSLIYD